VNILIENAEDWILQVRTARVAIATEIKEGKEEQIEFEYPNGSKYICRRYKETVRVYRTRAGARMLGPEDYIRVAKEMFLDMIAHSIIWEQTVDGEKSSYKFEVELDLLQKFVEVLGIKPDAGENIMDTILRHMAMESSLETEMLKWTPAWTKELWKPAKAEDGE
jgi:hypothetical protein